MMDKIDTDHRYPKRHPCCLVSFDEVAVVFFVSHKLAFISMENTKQDFSKIENDKRGHNKPRRNKNGSGLGQLTLYTLTSVCIFSILFSILFLRCQQGLNLKEFNNQELLLLVIVFFILVTIMCDSGVISYGEFGFQSLLGVKGLQSTGKPYL